MPRSDAPICRAVLLGRLYSVLACLGIAACATPIAPPGGPEDTTPPRLVESVPAADAVNVDVREVVLTFSELLEASTARRAVSLAPEPETPPEIEVDRRRLIVRFREPLLDSTTYVLTLGTELSDNHRVRLARPIPFAFSTGPQLDTGRLSGIVRAPRSGEPQGDLAVFAYAAPDTLPDPRTAAPAYRTQTAADGTFELAYLRDVPFFVVVVDDANRNRRADPGERFAVPPDPRVRPTLAADSLGQTPARFGLRNPAPLDTAASPLDTLAMPDAPTAPDSLTLPDSLAVPDLFGAEEESAPDGAASAALPFWTTTLDTIPPAPRSARALTARRVAVRFDESVVLASGARGWTVADSASGAALPVQAAYRLPDSPQQIVLALDGETTPAQRYLVRLDGPAVTDSAGNAAAPFERAFTPSSTADTLALRVAAFLPEPVADGFLPVDVRPGIRFSLPPPGTAYTATDTLGAALPLAFVTDDGVTFRLDAAPAQPVRLVAALRDTVLERTFRPAPEAQRGALLGAVQVDSTALVPGAQVGVEVWPAGASEPIRAHIEPGGRFSFGALPEGDYRLRFWLDVDGDGRWSGGRLVPYTPAEPLLVLREPERVRARWDTEIEDLSIEGDGIGATQ